MIEVKHLDKSFGDLHILKDISTNIEKGEKVVIIGRPVPVRVPSPVSEPPGTAQRRTDPVRGRELDTYA